MLHGKHSAALLLALGAAAACDGGPSGPDDSRSAEPGIHVVAGAGVADTIQAMPVQALTVRVVGQDGRPSSGVVVRFESVMAPGAFGPTATVLVGDIASGTFDVLSADTTDADGRASARVRLGTVAGQGGVVAIVPQLGLQDTVGYTVRPGAATRLISLPADSALYVGRSFALRAALVDRFGNSRSDAVSITIASGPVSVSGGTVSASAVGRGAVVAQAQGLADTSYVSVVPEGTIAAYTVSNSSSGGLAVYTMNLDGSDLRERVKSAIGSGYFGEMPSSWSADGRSLIYHDNRSDHTRQLYSLDLATGATTRLVASPGSITSEAWPQRSRDGQWIYFNGQVTWGGSMLYRVRPDGSGMAQVLPNVSANAGYASPSPDGTRLAYVSTRDYQGGGLETLDLRTSQVSVLKVRAGTPRWSPAGDLIAYIAQESTSAYFDHHSLTGSGELRVVRPDGTGIRTVTRTSTQFGPGIDWSPDGKYLVGTVQGVVTVVDVATGEQMPVRVGKSLVAPVWRP